MAAKKQTYEQAMKRLEEIVSRIDSNELDIDSLGVNLKEAQELIKFCRDKLYKADEEIKKMLDNMFQCDNMLMCQLAALYSAWHICTLAP